ncbi:UNVERIFIED_CONTAM: hypothetical protein RMT77_016305 [Armadillidium vulgare]
MQRNVTVQLSPISSSDGGNEKSEPGTRDAQRESEPCTSMRRGTLDFSHPIYLKLLTCKISYRNAVHLLMAAAEAFKYDTTSLIINRESFQHRRKEFRKQRQVEIKGQFNLARYNALVLH